MGSFSFTEIFTILIVILIIFGPNRLPEFARKVGEFIAKARAMTREFTETMQAEYSEGVESFKSVADEFEGAKKDLTEAFGAATGISTKPSPTPPNEDEAPRDVTDMTASSDIEESDGDEPGGPS